MNTYGTNPLNWNTDGDAIGDGNEVSWGYNPLNANNPIPASNGQEAIEKMAKMLEEEVPPDVTLMDLRMPVMDGLESSKQLSAMGVNNIHILTAYVDSDMAKVAVTVGVKGIMDKKEGFKAIAGRVADMVRDMRKADSD